MQLQWLLLLFLPFLAVACTSSETTEQETTTSSTEAMPTPETDTQRIVFFGNSLSAAYGLDDPEQGFVGIIEQRLDSLGYEYEVVNAGLSGETTAGGRERVDWILEQPVDIFVLELGGNDGLRGIQPESSYENLKAIIEKVRRAYPDAKILLAGMEAPPNLGDSFTTAFRQMYPKLAEEYDKVYRIPFLLEGVAAEPDLNLPDGIHPTAEGHEIVAENVWVELKQLLEKG